MSEHVLDPEEHAAPHSQGRSPATDGRRFDLVLSHNSRDKPSVIRQPLTGHGNIVHSVAFSPYGERLASAGNDGAIHVWEVSPASWIAQGVSAREPQPDVG